MKLVLDLQSAQGGSSRRGIGRQSLGLARALAVHCRGHEVVVAVSGAFPGPADPVLDQFKGLVADKNRVVLELPGPVAWNTEGSRETRERAELERERQLAALHPDLVHLSSLFEGLADESVTTIKPREAAYASSATLHDLMPLIHPGSFLTKSDEKRWYEHKLAELRSADLLLAVSESSRGEAIQYLEFDPQRLATISTAADERFRRHVFREEDIRQLFALYGLEKPFVMFTGGDSPQKNMEGLLRAYAALPATLRRTHQLLFACKIVAENRARLRQMAASLGLDPNDIIFTGYIPDQHLVAFYNLCRAFVFPSWHEGFGLPVLEAMSCGAAVIGSNCTSIPEVIGREDALFDPHQTGAIAALLQRVLSDTAFREELSAHGLRRSLEFTWEKSAARAWDAFEDLVDRKSGLETRSTLSFPQATASSTSDTGALAPPLLPGELREGIEYGVEGPSSVLPFLGKGWSHPEAWGIWSEENECTFWIRAPGGAEHSRFLEVEMIVHLRSWYSLLFFQVSVNGHHEISSFLGKSRRLRIPLRESAPGGLYQFRISISNPRMPSASPQGQDHRLLGVGLVKWVLSK